jgi:MoaA/NifB/PqqE/SkfB family radical SAM enzyme
MRSSLLEVLPAERDEEHSFCLFRIPRGGGRVLWQVTNICNYTCGYCIFSSGPSPIRGELDVKEIFAAMTALRARGFSHLKFTGGEPFARRDMVEILELTQTFGFECDISTNASLITEKLARRLRALTRLSMVHVSVDGPTAEPHEAARGAKTFAPTVRGLAILVAAGVPVRVGFVISKYNEHALADMAAFCRNAGAAELIFSIMEPAGRLAGDCSAVTARSPDEIAVEVAELSRRFEGMLRVQFASNRRTAPASHGTCPGGSRFLFIDHLGRVSPCSWLHAGAPANQMEPTLKTHSLDEVMSQPAMEAHFAAINAARNMGFCGCPLNWKRYARAA